MAIVENGGSVNVVGSSNPSKIVHKDVGFDHQSMKQNNDQQEFQKKHSINGNGVLDHHDNVEHKGQAGAQNIEHQKVNGVDLRNGGVIDGGQHEGKPGARSIEHQKVNGVELRNGEGAIDGGDEGFKKEMRDLEEMLSKLNPMAEEFVPPSLSSSNHKLVPFPFGGVQFGFDANNFVVQSNLGIANGNFSRRKKNGYGNGRKRMNTRTGMAQREDVIRRTVYVSEIDHQVTEEQLAALFLTCGQVVDCRICGDPNSVLRFAFIEFTDEEGARSALSLAGTVLGFYPVRVLPSKTAIAPVNPTFLPRSEDEREMCARTVYCANIDKKVTQEDVRLFFESFCGEVQRLRLLGDYHHSTRIAFVEFVMAESAIAALSCSGAILGSLPIRVSPSKTPVRPRAPRSPVL